MFENVKDLRGSKRMEDCGVIKLNREGENFQRKKMINSCSCYRDVK